MNTSVILIGPVGAGKSTVAKMLSQQLGLAHVSLDEVRHRFHAETDYDEDVVKRLRRQSFEELIRYWQPYAAHVVVRALSEHENSILDFGAIHSVYDDTDLLDKVDQVLAPYPNVILLLPSADLDESVRILHDRGKTPGLAPDVLEMWCRIIERFVKNPSNRRLSKHIVYTKDKTPETTTADVSNIIRYAK